MSEKIKNLTDRDLAILHSLYKFRTFTTPQMHELFFPGNKKRDYVWLRMSYLKRDGYIVSKPVVEDGRKVTHAYFLSAKGIETLFERGLIEKVAYAKDLQLTGHRMVHTHLVNDIYVQLKKFGYEMWDSRQVKAYYELDRNSLIQGCLVTPDEVKYGLYVIANDPEEKTIAQIMTEIKKHVVLENIMILCKTGSSFDNFERVVKNEETRIHSNVMCLPMDVAMIIFKTMFTEHDKVELYEHYGTVLRTPTSFFPYTVSHRGEQKYVAELLSNRTGIRKLSMQYTPYEYKRDGKKLLLLTWKGFRGELEREFAQYHHIEFETVPMRYLENRLENKLQTLSEFSK